MNAKTKASLRNRSVPLSNAQRHVLKQMGVRIDKKDNITEKQAVMLVKRIVDFESAYVKSYTSPWTRKRRTHKPKGISVRQHRINMLIHTEENGSKRASKELAKL